jgi:DNA polymerase-1
VLGELAWPLYAVEGYEADDILASAAHSFPGKTVVVSGDKYLLACVSQKTEVMLLRPGEIRRCQISDVEEIFGVPPERVVDWKALVGDPSDGISGVPGIGPQRAKVLLDHFRDLDSLLGALAGSEELSLPGITAKQLQNLRAHEEEARRSYDLARLRTEIPLPFSDLCVPAMPREEDVPALCELGLGDLAKQLFPEKVQKKKQQKLDDLFDSMW